MKARLFIIGLLIVGVIVGPFFSLMPAKAAFQPNRIIDDVVFDNFGSMNAAQINGFLNGFQYSCISPNNGFQARIPTGYSPNGGYTYGNYGSAGEVIAAASQAYSINPQVLLVTLEKEQSLVSGQNSSSYCAPQDDNNHKYAAAVGYGCPDSSTRYNYTGLDLYRRNGVTQTSVGPTCVNSASKAGFSQQVIRAAWLLKFGEERSEGKVSWAVVKDNWNNSDDPQTCYGGPMTSGTWQRCPNGPSVAYDGYTAIDGSSVHMDSGATASLFWYTPHMHGNQMFSDYFTKWFGLPFGTKILKKDGDPAFYLYNSGQKLKIPSFDLYKAYGFDKVGVTIVSGSYLDNLPSGNDLTTLARGADGTVHLIAQGRRYIVTGDMCTAWGLDCYNPYVVNTIDSDMLNVPNYSGYLQPLMRTDNGAIYKMSAGKKAPFLNTDAILQNGYNFSQITNVEYMSAGQPLGDLLVSQNTAFKLNNSNSILVYTGQGQYGVVGDVDTFYAWGLDRAYYPTVPASSLDTQAPTTSFTLTGANRIINYQSKKYIVDSGRKIDASSVSSDWPSGITLAATNNLMQNIPTQAITAATCFRTDNGRILQIQNSSTRTIRTFDDIYYLGCNPDTLVPLTSSTVSRLNSGPDAVSTSRPFKVAGDGAIYLVNGKNSSVRIASYANFVSLGLAPQDVYSVDTTTGAAYGVSGNATSYGQKNGVYYIYSSRGVKYVGSKEDLNAWGVTNFDPVYSGMVGDRLTSVSSTRFAHTASGAIYYASGGSKHLITNYASYVNLGGNPGNTMEVLDDFIASLPTGTPIQ